MFKQLAKTFVAAEQHAPGLHSIASLKPRPCSGIQAISNVQSAESRVKDLKRKQGSLLKATSKAKQGSTDASKDEGEAQTSLKQTGEHPLQQLHEDAPCMSCLMADQIMRHI